MLYLLVVVKKSSWKMRVAGLDLVVVSVLVLHLLLDLTGPFSFLSLLTLTQDN